MPRFRHERDVVPERNIMKGVEMGRKGGLGRGLSALIPTEVKHDEQQPAELRQVPVSHIRPNPHQPRQEFDEEALDELTASIRELGVLQPVLLRAPDDDGDHFELIAGERRWRAAKRAGLSTVPALVRVVDDRSSLAEALVENLQRQDLNALETAAAYQQLMEEFGLTHEQVAERVGKSRSAITNALRLFQLPPSVQRLVAEGRLTGGHARALLGTPDRSFQESLARRAAADGLSVRTVEDAVRERTGDPEDGEETKASTRPRLRPPGLLELEQLLSSHLDTRVKVDMGGKHGKVVIQFADLEDLERLYRRMTSALEVG
jgi:ParB family chromosome partitioning protein